MTGQPTVDSRRTRRHVVASGTALALALTVLLLTPPASATTSTITISGSVACRGGHTVEGVWVESSGGGSEWAAHTRRTHAAWIADYTATFTTETPTQIRLHVGCGTTKTGGWWSNNRTGYYSTPGSKAISAICKEAEGTGTRCGTWPEQALLGMPFSGRYGKQSPSAHHTSGDWSIDLYQVAGTAVRVKVFLPKEAPLTLKVNNVRTTCGTAGKSVRVDVIRSGLKIGWVDYGHLASVPSTLKKGTKILNNTKLGVTKKWPTQSSKCWSVTTDEGVHTHFTAFDYDAHPEVPDYACWAPHKMGAKLVPGRWIGAVGLTAAKGSKQACK